MGRYEGLSAEEFVFFVTLMWWKMNNILSSTVLHSPIEVFLYLNVQIHVMQMDEDTIVRTFLHLLLLFVKLGKEDNTSCYPS